MNKKILFYRKAISGLLLFPVFLLFLISCDGGGGGGSSDDSDSSAAEMVAAFDGDTMDEVYSDYWISEDGTLGLILKDNTYMLVPDPDWSESGVNMRVLEEKPRMTCSPYTIGTLEPSPLQTSGTSTTGSLNTQATTMYVTSEVVEEMGNEEFEEIVSYIELEAESAGYTFDFDSSDMSSELDLDTWMDRDDFESSYVEYQEVYYEYYFEYVEVWYYDITGLSFKEFSGWDDMLDYMLGISSGDIDDFFPENNFDIEIDDSGDRREMRTVGFIEQDYSFLESYGGSTLYTPQ